MWFAVAWRQHRSAVCLHSQSDAELSGEERQAIGQQQHEGPSHLRQRHAHGTCLSFGLFVCVCLSVRLSVCGSSTNWNFFFSKLTSWSLSTRLRKEKFCMTSTVSYTVL